MARRYRWYKIFLGQEKVLLKDLLASFPFVASASFGFQVVYGDYGNSKYRFISRSKVFVTSLSEQGDPVQVEIDSLNCIDFYLLDGIGCEYIKLEDPGRNLKDFFLRLEDICGYGFLVSPVDFDLVFISDLCAVLGNAKLMGVKMADVVIDRGMVAKLDVSSDSGILLDNIDLLRGKKFRITNVEYRVVSDVGSGMFEISHGGLVKVSGVVGYCVIDLIDKMVVMRDL